MKTEPNQTTSRRSKRRLREASRRDGSAQDAAAQEAVARLLDRRAADRRAAGRRAADRAEESDAERQESDLRESLAHMVVHDLRTPLTSLLTGLQAAASLSEMSPEQQKCIGIAMHGGQTLLGMVNDLLDISKMENDTIYLDRSRLDVDALVCAAVAQVAPLIERKKLALSLCIEPGASLWADEEKMERVLVNLLGNAIKFTPRGGAVRLEASAQVHEGLGEALVIRVTDTGEGIPQESLGKIFDKFGQAEERQAGRTASTGLGLTFCKMAVEAHGGTIGVQSEIGRGSVFTIAIPACHDQG